MLQRCENNKSVNYKNYGGRGITVCDEWHDFKIFVNWAYENGYKEKEVSDRRNVLSIERIDVNKNYEPNNCKWIPFKEQAKNKRYSGRKPMCGRQLGGNNDDYEQMIISAERYALGRMTYIVEITVNYILKEIEEDKLSDRCLDVIAGDIRSTKNLGMKCDKELWINLLKRIEEVI